MMLVLLLSALTVCVTSDAGLINFQNTIFVPPGKPWNIQCSSAMGAQLMVSVESLESKLHDYSNVLYTRCKYLYNL